jgi:cation:H+ antiporter
MIIVFIKFVICSLLIIFAGIKVAKYGDIIAEKTGLGRVFVGLLLLSVVTSLAEVFCGISAVTIVGNPDLTMGDIFGSCIFNLVILAILDLINKKEPFLYRADHSHIIMGACFTLLMGIVLGSILISRQAVLMPVICWIGLYTPIIAVVYLLSIKAIHRFSQSEKQPSTEEQYGQISLKAVWWKFGIASAIVVGAAMYLPEIGEEIAEKTGLAQTFVGTLFLATVTSFPELVVTIAAWKMGAKNMAIANILGSNLFDLLIIANNDIFYLKGSFLSAINPAHVITGLTAIMMTGVVMIGLMSNSNRKTFRIINWDALVIIVLFFTSVFFLYHFLIGG